MFLLQFVFAAILACAMAAPEPKADPQLLIQSGLAAPYIYTYPYGSSIYSSSYGYTPYAANYYNYAYGPYARTGLYY